MDLLLCAAAKLRPGLLVRSCWLIDLPLHTPCARPPPGRRTCDPEVGRAWPRVGGSGRYRSPNCWTRSCPFQLDADQNVASDDHREQQMTGHRRRSPDHEQDAERDRLPLPVQNEKLATAHRWWRYFCGQTIAINQKQKATRALHRVAFARLHPPGPSRDSVSGRMVCGWRCPSRV